MLVRFHLRRRRTPSPAWTPSAQVPSQSPLTNASPPFLYFPALIQPSFSSVLAGLSTPGLELETPIRIHSLFLVSKVFFLC